MPWVECSIPSVTFLPYNFNLIMIKPKIERHTRKVAILMCKGHESHGKTKELFQTEEDNEMTTECNV